MLAIVIPYYKLNFFGECLESLVKQTNKNFKVYIGNDASPDDPIELINSYSDKLKITYQLFERNLGGTSLPKQWDRCIDMVHQEEWIMILGDDDVLDINIVENFFSNYNIFIDKTNVIRFASKVIDSEGNQLSHVYRHPEWEKATDSFFRWLNGKTRSSLSEHLFTREAYNKYKFKNYPLGWHSDDIAWLDFPDGKKIYSINTSIVFIRQSGINITSATDNLELKEEASIRFQYDLIFEKLIIFSKPQKRKLLLNFEIFQKRKKIMNLKDWQALLIFYFQYSNLFQIGKLVRRFIFYQLDKMEAS